MDDLVSNIALSIECSELEDLQVAYVQKLSRDCGCYMREETRFNGKPYLIVAGEPNIMTQFWQELHVYFAKRNFLEKCLNK